MENLFNRLKKGFGIEDNPEPAGDDADVQANGDREQLPSAPALNRASSLPSTPVMREEIIRFIIQSLQPYVDERRITISGLNLYVLCKDKEAETLAEAALLLHSPDAFRNEHLERKLMNNFIRLSEFWFFEATIVRDALPDCSSMQGNLGLQVSFANDKNSNRFAANTLKVLVGQTAINEYVLNSRDREKYSIGRGEHPLLSSGRIHTNDIIFLDTDHPAFNEQTGKVNLKVSRNHAYIKYVAEFNRFYLYADKGGLPENGNKTKIYKSDDSVTRIDIAGIGHELHDGDIIELGGEAKLLFTI